jgi:hypothetical protein
VKETLEALGMDPTNGMPARQVALTYLKSVEGTWNGEVFNTRSFEK